MNEKGVSACILSSTVGRLIGAAENVVQMIVTYTKIRKTICSDLGFTNTEIGGGIDS